MKTIDFIENDIAKLKPSRQWLPWAFGLVLLCLSMAFGLGLREDLNGVWAWPTLLLNLGVLACLVALAWGYFRSEKGTGLIAVAAALILTFGRILIASQPTVYATNSVFWREASKCVVKGSVAGALAALILTALIFWFAPLPTAHRRLRAAAAAGLTSVGMLAFHCDSASWRHLLVSHVGPGVIVGVLLLTVQSGLSHRRLKSQLGPKTFSKIF